MATKIRVGQINFNADFDIGGHKITNVGNPTTATDVANKAYVDSIAQGLRWKEPARVATTGNITLSGLQTIDGVSVAEGNRVLVINQTNATENGIYVASSGSWSRSGDADTGSELVSAALFVSEGTTNGDKGFVCTNNEIIIGTTNITFVTFTVVGGYSAGNGIEIIGNVISAKGDGTRGIGVDASGIYTKVVSNGGVKIDATNGLEADNAVLQFLSDYKTEYFQGDGTTTDFTLTYPPYYGSGSNNIIVTLNGLVQKQGVDYTVDTVNNQIDFVDAPANGDVIIVYYSYKH